MRPGYCCLVNELNRSHVPLTVRTVGGGSKSETETESVGEGVGLVLPVSSLPPQVLRRQEEGDGRTRVQTKEREQS